VHLHAEVPRESPTVRGYVALLLRTLNGAPPAEVAEVPDDLLGRLRLVETLGMMRVQGLTAILRRVKQAVASKAR
jgi:cysteine desulfuration protein SufE